MNPPALMRAALSRWGFLRTGRKSRDPYPKPNTPGVPAEAHPYVIHDFFAFRGVLFGRGVVDHALGDLPRLSVLLEEERWLPVEWQSDPVNPSTPTKTAFSFHVTLPSGVGGEATAKIKLFIHFRAEHLHIIAPGGGRLKADRFLSTEAVFWEHIRGLSSGCVLEVGARARSGITRRDLFPPGLSYVGFDIVAGPNVDVVGDAHELSAYFPAESFDAVFSIAVWEHLVMPWKVSLELNRVLKTGGIAMINTHQAWPSHEEPWDYFRFSEYAWASLFNRATGFEILAAGMGFPGVMAAALALPHHQAEGIEWHYGYLASRCVVRKIAPTSLSWPVATKDVAVGTYDY